MAIIAITMSACGTANKTTNSVSTKTKTIEAKKPANPRIENVKVLKTNAQIQRVNTSATKVSAADSKAAYKQSKTQTLQKVK